MIKVNLVGACGRKASKGPGGSLAAPRSVMPLVLVAVVLGTALSGYWRYAWLSGQSDALAQQIDELTKQKKALEAVIRQDQVYEARKKALENRVAVIEGLQKNQVSPVVSLDLLSEAIDRTQYIWLSNLAQNDNNLSMSGTGTSMLAIADFVTNLGATGYFPKVELISAVENAGNVTFSITAEFLPPQRQVERTADAAAPTTGGS